MPAVGKSTIAVHLGANRKLPVIDLDKRIEEAEGTDLITVLKTKGADYFLNKQFEILQQLTPEQKIVISTPGSMIYHEEAMQWLSANTTIFHLDAPLDVIKQRLAEQAKAIVGLDEKSIDELHQERMPVYRKWSDQYIDQRGLKIPVILQLITSQSDT